MYHSKFQMVRELITRNISQIRIKFPVSAAEKFIIDLLISISWWAEKTRSWSFAYRLFFASFLLAINSILNLLQNSKNKILKFISKFKSNTKF